MSPSQFEAWSNRDRRLAEALRWHEVTRNAYGIPFEKATNPEFQGMWKVEAQVDHSMVALEQWRKDHAEPGAIPVVSLDEELASDEGRKGAAARQRELRERARSSRSKDG